MDTEAGSWCRQQRLRYVCSGSPPGAVEGNDQRAEEPVKPGRDKLRQTSHTVVLDFGRRNDWQHSDSEVELLSQLEWLLSSQE